MIEVLDIKGKKIVSSWELCKYVAHSYSAFHDNYNSWLNSAVFPFAIHGYDYFSSPENIIEPNKKLVGRKPNRYIYFSLDFAITICYMTKSRKSIHVRNYLIQKKTNENKPQ